MNTIIIAEAGVNHNGSLERAQEMIRIAAECGVDIVKFQAWSAELLTSSQAVMADYQILNTGTSTSQLELLKGLELPRESYPSLIETCKEVGVGFLCTPMDLPSIGFLADLKVASIKVPSGEVTNAPYLVAIGQTKIPIILSTGMATVVEIEAALGAVAWGFLNQAGKPSFDKCVHLWEEVKQKAIFPKHVTLLHCTTEYPAPLSDVNLLAMRTLKEEFLLPVGYSDHTAGINVSIAAASLGAVVIEKHFTLDRNLPGPDHMASIEPGELKELVTAVREVNLCLGHSHKVAAHSEIKNIPIARKSLIAACNIKVGEKFTETNLAIKRPGSGESPWKYWDYLDQVAKHEFLADQLIKDD